MKKSENPLSVYKGAFSCIEQKLVRYPVVGFDSEDNSKGIVTLYGFYSARGGFATKYHTEALDYIYSYKEPTIFVAHNLEYDFVNFFKHDNYDLIDTMAYSGSRLLQFTVKGLPHKFIDSSSFFRGPLAALGKFMGLEKLEGDSQSVEYVIRDAQIPYQFITEFQDGLIDEEGVNLGVTIGQMAMDIYRRKYMTKKRQITYNSPNCLKAFYGGRVELFYLGILDGVTVTDINSCYPDVMRNCDYPETANIMPSTIGTHEFGIGKFTVTVPDDMLYPILPYKDEKSGRLFFPTGTFTGYWTYAEIRYAQSLGVIILDESEGEGTNSVCRPFVSFVDDYFEKKKQAKARGDKANELRYKLWLNNLFGKWVQHHGGDIMSREKIPLHKLEKHINHPEFKTKKIGPFYFYHIPKDEPPKTANYLWGVYVTSYGRIKLHKGIMSVHKAGYQPVYCDTDSVMYTGPKELTESPLPISKNLGDWDVEKFDVGIFRQAKTYILYDREGDVIYPVKVACKGVPTAYAHEFLINAMATFQKPMRLKEGLIRTFSEVNEGMDAEFLKDLGANVWNDVTKEMQSVYIKRKLQEGKLQGLTYPQNVNDLDSLVVGAITGEAMDYHKETAHLNLVDNLSKKKFKQSPIAPNYFEALPAYRVTMLKGTSERPYHLDLIHLVDIPPKSHWFRGTVVGFHKYIRRTKMEVSNYDPKVKGKFFIEISVYEYKGSQPPQNFNVEISAKIITQGFLGQKDLLNKPLAIYLESYYNGSGYPNLVIKILDREIKTDFEPEDSDDENELSETDKEKILNFKLEDIICQN